MKSLIKSIVPSSAASSERQQPSCRLANAASSQLSERPFSHFLRFSFLPSSFSFTWPDLFPPVPIAHGCCCCCSSGPSHASQLSLSLSLALSLSFSLVALSCSLSIKKPSSRLARALSQSLPDTICCQLH